VLKVPVDELITEPVTVLSAKFAVYKYWFEGSSRMQRGEDPDPDVTLVFEVAPDKAVSRPVVGSMKYPLIELAGAVAVKLGPRLAR
jgi:hypothetical protein